MVVHTFDEVISNTQEAGRGDMEPVRVELPWFRWITDGIGWNALWAPLPNPARENHQIS